MANRLTHYLRGTKYMEGAWPEGTEVNEYGDRIVHEADTTPFLIDLGNSVVGIPSSMVQWWKDSHRWPRDEYIYEAAVLRAGAIALVAFEHPDYRLWKRLGIVSDALLMLIVLIIVLAVFA